jgi:hypothetical protein
LNAEQSHPDEGGFGILIAGDFHQKIRASLLDIAVSLC